METKITELAYRLKKEIDNDPRVILLNNLETKLNNDEEVMTLSYQKDRAVDHYEDMTRLFKSDSKEAISATKELSLAKEKLMNHPLVKEYLSAYKEVKDLYEEINRLIFYPFMPKLCDKVK